MILLGTSFVQLRRVALPQRAISGNGLFPSNNLLPLWLRSMSTSAEEPSSNDITRSHIIKSVADTHGLSKSQSERIVVTVFDSIVEAVGDGKNVKIASFGSFEKYVARPRSATNFQSKERIQVPSKNRIRFKPYKSFKKIVETSNPTTSKGPETKFGDGES